MQEPDESLRVDLRLHRGGLEEDGAALPHEVDGVRTWQTTTVRMPSANASAAGFPDGSFVRLHAGPGSRFASGLVHESSFRMQQASDDISDVR